jgi:Putative Ig domain
LVGAVICLTAVLAACGGDDEGDAAAQTLTISGTPGAQALLGQQYSFTPTVTPSSGTLTFSITGTPAWATFSSSNGRLSGTPSSAQVGMTASNIRISVSDGTTTANLPAFAITVVATATGSAMLSWNPPTQNTDGSPLTNLAGYRVYWGTSQGNLSNSTMITNPGLSSYVVEQLTPATWYFALSAVASSGVESALSNVASKQVM